MKTALQLYSVRDEVEKDFEGTLKAVSEFGYDGVEFAGLYGKTPEDVRKLCEKYGLVPVSAHVGIGEMLENEKGIPNIKIIIISTSINLLISPMLFSKVLSFTLQYK